MSDDDDISIIIPNKLYLSSLHCRYQDTTTSTTSITSNRNILNDLNITTIIDLSNTPFLPKHSNISYYTYHIEDNETQDITLELEQVYQIFLNEIINNSGKVLIHCIHGISRSATFVIYCLMKYQLITLKMAFQYVKGIRRIILPNVGFLRQLINAERDLYGVNTLKLGKYGQFIWLDNLENKEEKENKDEKDE